MSVNILQNLDILFQVTTNKIQIDHSDELLEKIQMLTSHSSQEVQNAILSILETICNTSQEELDTSGNRCFFFRGAPGLGKTYISRKFSEIIPIPVLELDAGDFDLTQQGDSSKMESNLGKKIISAVSRYQRRGNNILILMDEADRLYGDRNINRPLIDKLANSGTLNIDLDGTPIPINISNAIIIMTGNKTLPKPLMNIQHTKFEDYTKNQKFQIGLKKLEEQSLANDFDLDEEDLEELKNFVDTNNQIGLRSLENKLEEIVTSKRTAWEND